MVFIASLVLHCVLMNDGPQDESRSEFARALASVQLGDSKTQVLRRLGRPDKKHDGTRFPLRVENAWAYGVVRAGDGKDFAALGCVGFGRSGSVSEVYGARGTPANVRIEERRLKQLLGHIDAIGDVGGSYFNPLFFIRAVNVLCEYNKQEVVAIVNEYQRVWSPMSRTNSWGIAFLLETLLKDPFPIQGPPPILGAPSVVLPKSKKHLLPRFPILIVDDVPLMLNGGYTMFGSSGKIVPMYSKWFLGAGEMRRRPLCPNDNPLNVRKSLTASVAWKSYVQLKHNGPEMVYRQLVRLWYGVGDPAGFGQLYETPNSKKWYDIAGELDSMGIRWDAKKGWYVVPKKRVPKKRVPKMWVHGQTVKSTGRMQPNAPTDAPD